MDQSLSIGEFARLTHLPVKTLRHYHQVGVLVPARVDPATGWAAAVATDGLATTGPIRERYLISPAESEDPRDWRTEVCWPISN